MTAIDQQPEVPMTEQQVCEFLAFAMMCRMFTECVAYRPTPVSAKATRAELRRQGLPIPGRSASR